MSSENFTLIVVDDGSIATIFSDKNDASVYFPLHGFVDPNNRTNSITGGGYVDGKQMSSVFPFELPAIPSGFKIIDAKFSVNLETVANVDALVEDVDYKPTTSIEEGISKFVAWYREFYHV